MPPLPRTREAQRIQSAAMKRILALTSLAFLLLGCPKPEASSSAMKVGLLTPGSVNDNGWNAIAYEGLQEIHKQLHAEISNQETKTPAEVEEGFRSYGA